MTAVVTPCRQGVDRWMLWALWLIVAAHVASLMLRAPADYVSSPFILLGVLAAAAPSSSAGWRSRTPGRIDSRPGSPPRPSPCS
ncbi:hypothetical protein KIV56_13760 [Cryobacterium breve]|uniref:Uncharacterized protein n=1 Tax=Cryobacterium breve TaxID=1259258 RepID=A0ABY7NA93_9MICO|nr:hypothetical protein [Cryobacterium breve]WBM79426.1 hypothetical protein KIV56_13760 [Cryobacterium breve]